MPTISASHERWFAARARAALAVACCLLLRAGVVAAEPVAAAAAPVPALQGAGHGCELEPDQPRAVAKVIDGETLQLQDGTEVRLVGALAPRAFDAGVAGADWPAEREARAALEGLVSGRAVVTATAGRKHDRYGRLLAQVYLVGEGAPVWLQGAMLAAGHARAYVLAESTACAESLLAHEAAARGAASGLWRNPAYAVRDAARTGDLLRLRNGYQIVEGTVAGVGDVRGHIYVNFGEDWRTDFTAGVATARADRQWLDEVRGLAGKRVQVRGWIERQNGPYVAVIDRSQIQVLGSAAGALPVAAGASDASGAMPEAGAPAAEPAPATRRKRRAGRDAPATLPAGE